MTIKPYGDQAILVEFDVGIDPAIHQKVTQLYQTLKQANLEGVKALIPAYHSLTICYHPLLISKQELATIITSFSDNDPPIHSLSKTLHIPVCYEATFALDIETVLQETELSKEALIQLHTQTVYQVYLLGFLPGFAYLGKIPEALFCKRKQHPRLKIPAGSVGLAGYQTGIYPSASPGGWQIIGQTPITVFDINQAKPFLFEVGNRVKFERINSNKFEAIQKGTYTWDLYST